MQAAEAGLIEARKSPAASAKKVSTAHMVPSLAHNGIFCHDPEVSLRRIHKVGQTLAFTLSPLGTSALVVIDGARRCLQTPSG